MIYSEYIKTPHWKALRAKAIFRDSGQCTVCGSRSKLEVHHLNYRNLGHESMEDLTTLCGRCHAAAHTTSLIDRRKP